MDKPKVSIIIPFYNSQQYLAETLASVASQSYSDWECLCVDDGSTDHSPNIVEGFIEGDDRFKIFRRPPQLKKGGNSCRNYGFQQANGKYIQWFDSDDLMHPQMLEEKVNALELNQGVNYVICHTGYFINDDVSNLVPYDQNLKSRDVLFDYLNYRTKFFTPGPMFRKSFLNSMGLFNVNLMRHQEWEFFFRIILKDEHYVVLNDVLVLRRMHNSQLSLVANKSSDKALMKFAVGKLNYENFILSKKADRRIFCYFRRFFFKLFYPLFREGKYRTSMQCIIMFVKALKRKR